MTIANYPIALVRIIGEHWYYGTEYKEFVIYADNENEYWEMPTAKFYYKLTAMTLNRFDRHRIYGDYKISVAWYTGEALNWKDISEEIVNNVLDGNIPNFEE